MFEIGIVEEFEAILSLDGDFGLATRLHGHTYKVQVVVQGDVLGETGVLYDSNGQIIYSKPCCTRFSQRDKFGGNIGYCWNTSFFQFNRALDKPGRTRPSVTLSCYYHVGILSY